MRPTLLVVCLLFCLMGTAQTKSKSTDKPPTQKELAEIMKEMQAAMDEMSPEEKRMMDSLGFKLPSANMIPKMSDKQLAEAWENDKRIVPKRDAARIAAIPKAVTNSKMAAYIAAVQTKVSSVLKPAVITAGNELYNYIKSNSSNASEAGTMATGIWLAGQPEVALYVLGKVCADDATNTDNLSNYSAMLSMNGAQHLAIPILNNLNAQYPKNSTLLNNLGQAWFGLGEIGKAEKYLDSAIRIYAYHPQANLTKSLIEESKGNKQAAIEAVKRSIAKAYSTEKEARLNKLGYDHQPNDLAWDRPMPQDPLGLEKFKWPDYPMSVASCEILETEWDAFKKRCSEEMDKLRINEEKLEQEAQNAHEARTKQLLFAGQRRAIVYPFPPMAHKAMIKLKYLVDDKDGHLSFSFQKKVQQITDALAETAAFDEKLSKQLKDLDEKYEDLFGEGKPNPFDAACSDDTKAKDDFLRSSNTLLRNTYSDFLAFMRRKINNETYYNQYTMWPEMFELEKVRAKIKWLSLLQSQKPQFKNKTVWCQDKREVGPKSFKLADFDDIACDYKSSLNLGCIKMETNCGQTTTTYGCGMISFAEKELGQNYVGGTLKISPKVKVGGNAGPLSAEGSIGADVKIELDANNEVKNWDGKVTAGVEGGVGVTKGPVKMGASVSGALEIEIGSDGIKDVNIVSAAKVEAGIEAPKLDGNGTIDAQINKGIDYANQGIGKLNTKVELGVESRTSLISGHGTVNGTGLLNGVKMSE